MPAKLFWYLWYGIMEIRALPVPVVESDQAENT